ncbi:T9SS type A sorting domain-containing protein [Reichenbachiella versicolor]|uniref:T9SS type A sorting domain-containing protein n=1 Tax=Reichenbachiella versicolor TaxID=1821036 RepID=UPI000D6E9E21|nr:T9SS type A sorting domain-containing protein [Reichenbachiella versicolor]
MKNLYTLLIFLLIGFNLSAQNGPAGIGDGTGSSGPRNVLWLDASTLNLSNDDPITIWPDLSGNGNDLTQQATDPVPFFRNDGLGGANNVVRFDGTERYLTITDGDATALDNIPGITIYIVANLATVDTNPRGLISKRNSANNQSTYSLFTWTGSDLYNYIQTSSRNTLIGTNPLSGSTNYIINQIFDGTNQEQFISGSSNGSVVHPNPGSIANSSSTLFLGTLNNNYGTYMDGDMAEVIIYGEGLNDAERIIVDNYLSAKYNIALGANDYYTEGSYSNNVIGIGNDGTDSYMSSTGSGAGLTISGTTGVTTETFDGGEWVFAGNDGGSTLSTFADIADADVKRINRVWKLEKTEGGANPGTGVTLTFNISDLDLSGFTNFVLYKRTSTSGNFTSLGPADATTATEITFNLTDAETDDAEQYFTIGFDSYSPAGVDSNLALWLDANTGVTTTGSQVSNWEDQSSNTNSANDPSTLSSYNTSQTNFNAGLQFDGDATSLEGSVTKVNNDLTIFTVYQDNAANNSAGVLLDLGGFSIADNSYNGGAAFSSNITKNQPAIVTIDHPAGTTADIYVDGNSFESSYTTTSSPTAGLYNYVLGDDADGSNTFSGTLNETIIYDGSVSPSDREEIESYLAIKYGITLGHDYLNSTGTIVFDVDNSTANDGYESGITAIGTDYDSRLIQNISSSSSDIVVLSTENDFSSSNDNVSTSLADNEFLFISNDGGSTSLTTIDGNSRVPRVWKVNETNNPGSVFLGIPTSLYTLDSMWVSTDPTFATGVTRIALTNSGSFNSVTYDFTDGDYFTFTADQILSTENENLRVWLKADRGVNTSASEVTLWEDQSIHGSDANNDDTEFDSQGDLSTQNEDAVAYNENGLNFNPSISFANDDRPITGSFNTTEAGATIFIVGRSEDNSGTDDAWFDTYEDGQPNGAGVRTYFFETQYNGGGTFSTNLAEDIGTIYTIEHRSDATADIYENGVSFETGLSVSNNMGAGVTRHYVLGDDATGGNEFSGQLSEFMFFQSTLSAEDRVAIESYLAIKYSIRLSSDYVNTDKQVVFDLNTTHNDNFENNIVAIAREDILGLDQKVSKSESGSLILALEDDFESFNLDRSISLSDKQYVFASSNVGSLAADSSYRTGTNNRIGRKWKINETNSPGSIFVGIPDNVASDLNVLIVSSDSTFASSTEVLLTQEKGFYYASYDFSDGDYFTFANSEAPAGISAGLKLWLAADQGVTDVSGDVSDWADISGNANDATTPGTDPTIIASSLNYNPAINFTAAGNRVQGSFTSGSDSLTVFIVATDSSAAASGNVLFELDDTVTPLTFTDGAYGGVSFSGDISKEEPLVITVTQPEGSGPASIYQNGGSFESSITPAAFSANTYSYALGENVGGGNGFTGIISEFIVYDSALSDTERNIVESYLAIKYALPISSDVVASDGTTVLDATASAGYLENMVALANDSRTFLDQKVAKSINDSLYIAMEEDFSSGNTGRTSTFNDNEYLIITNDGGDFLLNNNYSSGTNNRLERIWKVHEHNNPGSVFLALPNTGVFTGLQSMLISSDPTFATGVLERTITTSGGYQIVEADLSNGQYFTFTTDAVQSNIWYSYLSGNWSDPGNWTLDGALSALYVNPNGEIPAEGDTVVITSGRSIVNDINGINIRKIEIIGTLDIGETSGHNFRYIEGAGTLRIAGASGKDNYPMGVDTLFYDATEGGTVEIYGDGIEIDTIRRYNNLNIELTASNDEVIQVSDSVYVFGNLTINQGNYQINDNSGTDNLALGIYGNLLIESNGKMSAGLGNARHELNLLGDFENNGDVRLTQRTTPNNGSEATDGIVDLNLISSNSDQNLNFRAGSTAMIYRIEIDKGVDATYTASLNADEINNFSLIGYADDSHSSTSQLTVNNNKLGLLYGTVEIGNNISIDQLSSGNYNVSEGAKLTVNGGAIESTGWIVTYGAFEISSGLVDMNSGAVSRESGSFLIDGGTLNLGHFRTSQNGFGSDGSWTQNGGIVNIDGRNNGGEYYAFSWTYETCSYTMTGGELNVSSANNVNNNGIFLNIANENQTVTGGTVTLDMVHDDLDSMVITSNVPFYNLILRQTGTNANTDAKIIIDEGNSGGGAPDGVTLTAQTLKVLNDFTIEDGVEFDTNDTDVEIGGSLTIGSGTTVDFDGAEVTFNQSNNAQISLNTGATLALDTLVLNKTNERSFLTMNSGEATILQIDQLLNVTSGNLDLSTFDIRVENALSVSDTIGATSNTGQLYFNGPAAQSISSSNGFIYDLQINNSNGTTLSGDLTIDDLILDAGVFDIGISRLTSQSSITTNTAFDVTNMIQTDGNVSDGGLEVYVDAQGTYLYPIGTDANSETKYTPVEVDVSANYSDDGYIAFSISDNELPTLQATGNALSYFWRANHREFTNTTNLISQYRFTYDNRDTFDGTQLAGTDDHFPGYVLDEDPFTTVRLTSEVDATNTITFDGNLALVDNVSQTGSVQDFDLVNANYTAGTNDKFAGAVEVYYNIQNVTGSWNNNSTWFEDAARTIAASDYPRAGDIAVISGNNFGDAVNVNGTQEAAQIIFEQTGTYNDLESLARLRFSPTDQLTVGSISGEGDIYLQRNLTNAATLNADIGDFAENERSVIIIYLTEDGSYTITESEFFTVLPTLRLYGQLDNYSREISFDYDFTAKNLSIDGEASLLIGGNYTVENLTELGFTGPGRIRFPNGTESYTFTTGDLTTTNNKNFNDENTQSIEVLAGNTNDIDHRLIIQQDFILDFFDVENVGDNVNIDLYNSETENNVILEFQGTGNHTFRNDFSDAVSNIELYQLVVNKGVSTDNSIEITTDFTQNAAINQPLDLQNGNLILNNSGLNVEIANGSSFTIPSTAGLEVTDGTVTANNGDIILGGLLRVNGGTVDLDNTDIEYSSSGSSTIEVSSGTLEVGGQVRRSLTSTDGILVYRQTGGDVDIAVDGTSDNTRAAFEVLNSGSELTLTGGTFNIVRGVTGDTNESLELDPTTYDLTGSTISIFENLGADYGSNYFNIKSTIPLNNLTIDNTIDLPDVRQYTQGLQVNDLTINTNQAFLANGFNLAVSGNFTNNGSYTNTTAETDIAGSAAQTIGGSGSFDIYDLRKSGAGSADLTVSLDLGHDFHLDAGILDIASNSISLQNDAFIEGTLTNSGGNGLVFNGVSNQDLHGAINSTVSIGTVTINNAAGIDIPEGNGYDFDITENLRLDGGVFNIGGSLVTLTRGATITEVSPFNVNNMIQTNSSFTDNGLKLEFHTVDADTSLFFPIGELKYTPVDFNLDAGTTQGGIRIRPANEMHPTIIDDVESGEPSIVDQDNVLQYHWIVVAEDLTNANGSAVFTYDHDDIEVTVPYDTTNYISARLLSNDINWDKFAPTEFLGASTSFRVPLSNFTSSDITGDYTAGVGSSDGINNDIEGAIPDQLAQYISSYSGAGIYSTDGSWTPVGSSPTLSSGIGPVGAQVTISGGDDVSLNISNIRLYSVHLEEGSILRVPNGTLNNRLGTVTGTGTIIVEDTELLPTGEYSDFFGCSGGTIQYSGTTDYNILAGISQVRKVILEGTGIRTMPNNNVSICDTLELNGPTVSFELGVTYSIGDAEDDRMEIQAGSFSLSNSTNIDLTGDFIMSGGSLVGEAGSSLAISSDLNLSGGTIDFNGTDVTFDGTTAQNIDGDFTSGQAFDDLTINNSSSTGVTLNSGDIEIDGTLSLTDGLLNVTASESLTINSSGDWADASAASYVNGPLTKDNLGAADNYTFPIGSSSRIGTIRLENIANGSQNWTASYSGSNGDVSEPINTAINVGYGIMNNVSGINSWTVTPSGSNTAFVELSVVSSMGIVDLAEIVVAEFDGPSSGEWVNQGGSNTGTISSGTVTSQSVSDFSGTRFTFGALTTTATPVDLIYFSAEPTENNIKLSWATASEIDNSHFEIERSFDGTTYEYIGEVEGEGTTNNKTEYDYLDKDYFIGTAYYRLVQVDLDGVTTIYGPVKAVRPQDDRPLDLLIFPNPTIGSNINAILSNVVDNSPINVVMVSMDGTIVVNEVISPQVGEMRFSIDPKSILSSGLYQIILKQGSIQINRKVIIK